MTNSIDNYKLYDSIIYGIVIFLLYVVGFLFGLTTIGVFFLKIINISFKKPYNYAIGYGVIFGFLSIFIYFIYRIM